MRRDAPHRTHTLLRKSILFAFIIVLAPPGHAKELRIERFEAEIVVSPRGTIDVTETIQAHFIGSPWHGLYREIPVEYDTPQGLNYTLFLDVTRVSDESGAPLKYESSRERHYRKLKIYVPDADDSRKTIVIEYRISDALRFFEDHDELYWNVTGDAWDVPIQSASASIILPESTTGIRANRFTGGFGDRAENADVQIAGNGVEVRTTRPLGYHEGLTVAVAWDKGFGREPTAADHASLFLRSNWPLFLPIFTSVAMFWVWWTRGRDPRLRPIAAQYEPPDKLSPGEAGTLVDSSAALRDITASIVDLAVRGYLTIEEHKKEHMMGLWSDKDYDFILRKPRSEWAELKPHEITLLNGIFSVGTAGESVSMSSLHNQFYTNLPVIRSQLFGALVTRGYYRRRPDTTRQSWLGFGLITGFLIMFGGARLAAWMGMAPLTFILAGILTGGVICVFGWFMPARTAQGAEALEHVLGFEDFLAHVESDRFNRMIKTPEMFEKFLPFAMALGVEKNWSKAFQNIYTQPPEWYRGAYPGQFYPIGFANDLHLMTAQAASVMASAPRSSGGSGFGGGGGFSGGGFGGGGGGGF